MAKLLLETEGVENRPLNLRVGTNRMGRDPQCDFPIDHSTVSSVHCEVVLSPQGSLIRDCNSTNGTFVDGEPVTEAWLRAGQTVHLGDVKLRVENTEITIAIPKVEKPAPIQHKFPQAGVGSPVVMPIGALVCPRHLKALATYKCNQCCELLCGKCIHVIQRKGGVALLLCPLCSGKCERINAEPPKKKSFLDTLRKTVKLPLAALAGRIAPKK